MRVAFKTISGAELDLQCSCAQFLDGPVMSHLAAINNQCHPAELVRDFLPEFIDSNDDEELAQYFSEACTQATRYEPAGCREPLEFAEIEAVYVESEDLPFIRNMFFRDRTPNFAFVEELGPKPAA